MYKNDKVIFRRITENLKKEIKLLIYLKISTLLMKLNLMIHWIGKIKHILYMVEEKY
jgi:hypothetical protein